MFSADKPLDVVIVGAGIGGLTAAIACRRAALPMNVTVLERCPEILTVGAGIHIPPNACRILTEFGLLEKLKEAGGYEVGNFNLVRYADGRVLASKPLRGRVQRLYNAEWIAIHRGDYQSVLLEEATASGANILTHAEAIDLESHSDAQTSVHLKDGRRLFADVVIGADGLWSHTRDIIYGKSVIPEETGDLAYRATFTRSQLQSLGDEAVNRLLDNDDIQVWLGPNRHAVFYPLRERQEFNLVLLVADDLPTGVRTAKGTAEEMTSKFENWDPCLTKIMSCSAAEPLKWKLLHLTQLERWTTDNTALLGDACHPSLPYLGQGAAIAVEDGAALGILLNKYNATKNAESQSEQNQQIARLLQLYQDLRKGRAEILVAGATDTRYYYHLPDGPAQESRDKALSDLASMNWDGSCEFDWGDSEFQRNLLSFDIFSHVAQGVQSWDEKIVSRQQTPASTEYVATSALLVHS
ncbi:hypothetical protein NLG97_g697 [Lecanicillium saksenae]|uniref:Uncharacterized protein n=1 Tax=Lecanicillium saksenae TaxID=468837 RepID=A0ACC1R6G7_9HYPO|nr:hypothetical protein NLG97_g697 [Lecanicillium saksenae]